MKNTVFLISTVALLSFSFKALAQDEGSFSAQNFQTAPGIGSYLTVEGAQVPAKVRFNVGALAMYQYRPVVVRGCLEEQDGNCTTWADNDTALVEHHVSAELLAAISFAKVFELGLAVPFILYQNGNDVAPTGTIPGVEAPDTTTGVGDLRLHLKFDLLRGIFRSRTERFGLALIPVVSFPIGQLIDSSSFMGEAFITVNTKLAFEVLLKPLRFSLNAGYLWRQTEEYLLAESGPRLTYGGAMEVYFGKKASGILEVFGQNAFSSDVTESPLEADLALRFKTPMGLAITIGGGAGIIAGVGTPMVRGFAGLTFSPPPKEEPKTVENLDSDGDGLLNADDKCPLEPEDKDLFQDEDGCPDLDNDADGLSDQKDQCPVEPEDKDFFNDEDGCPDPDNDEDGILDQPDQCPEAAEDVDQFEDENGCPDPDNDLDGILDADDKCLSEKENYNGVEDQDGCPDEDKEQLVVIKKEKIEILQQIHFATGKDIIMKDSFPILDAVVGALESHPEINLRVEGHTDSKGNRKLNLRLSEDRAKSVVRYLVEKGIDPDRLIGQGFGPDQPIDSNKTKEGRAANRRVEFMIVDL